MIRRVAMLGVMTAVALALLYASRWWPFEWWARGEMFGLPPGGGLVAQWLRGTRWAPFDLILWGVGAILVLTALRRLLER